MTFHLIGPCKVVTVFLVQVTDMRDLFGGTASAHTELTPLHILWLRHLERKPPEFGYAIIPYFLTKHKNMPQEFFVRRLVIFYDHRDNREASPLGLHHFNKQLQTLLRIGVVDNQRVSSVDVGELPP
jgi:hypothetical protein